VETRSTEEDSFSSTVRGISEALGVYIEVARLYIFVSIFWIFGYHGWRCLQMAFSVAAIMKGHI
jgi:cellobiose-specific phosphotransferase system component IIC